MKRVFIVHGWGGYPEHGWYPWLKKELEKKGFKVYIPQLPDTDNPKIDNFVPALAKSVGISDKQTYFIGHSIGNQTIARYLENLPKGIKIGGIVFIAGFFKRLKGLTENEKKIADPWIKSPIDLKKVKSHFDKSIAIFSDDDPFVPLDNQDDFKNKLGSKNIIEHNQKHFTQNNGITKLPIALKSVLEISNFT